MAKGELQSRLRAVGVAPVWQVSRWLSGWAVGGQEMWRDAGRKRLCGNVVECWGSKEAGQVRRSSGECQWGYRAVKRSIAARWAQLRRALEAHRTS